MQLDQILFITLTMGSHNFFSKLKVMIFKEFLMICIEGVYNNKEKERGGG